MLRSATARYLAASLFLGVACLAFAPGLSGPFLLDDTMNLMRARAPTGEAADVVDAIVRNSSGLLRRPISNLTFLLNYHVIGSSAFAYKTVNWLIHFGLALVLWRLGAALIRWISPGRAGDAEAIGFLAALVWTVHPIQVSTVLYIVQRMTQLSALFSAIALFAFVHFAQKASASTQQASKGIAGALAVLAAILLAVFSKENGALVPLMIGVIVLCSTENRLRQVWESPASRGIFLVTSAIPVAIGVIGFAVLWKGISTGYAIRDFTVVERILTQPFILGHYLWSFLTADIRMMGLYLDDIPIRRAGEVSSWLGIAMVAGVLGLAIALRRRAPLFAFAVLWFLACHAMESTVIPLELAFEHRNYLAVFGPALAISAGAWQLAGRLGTMRTAALLLIPILLLAGATLRRSHQWSVPNLFAETEYQNHPNSPRAIVNAAALKASTGDLNGANELLRRAQALRPHSFWMRAYDIHIACVDARVKPDWDALLSAAELKRNSLGLEEAIRPPARMILQGQCINVSPEEFDHFVARLIERVGKQLEPVKVERLHILRQQMATVLKQPAQADAMLRAAAASNPAGTDAITLLAYELLNRGKLDEAETIAIEWRKRIRLFHRSTMEFEVDEFESYLKEAREAQRGG